MTVTETLTTCRAGFDGCDAMRAEAIAKHPRTPRLAECQHYAIPAENPERLQGPEVGALCLYQGRNDPAPVVVRVLERSYVWAPGERSGARRYDLKVIARGPNGRRRFQRHDHRDPTAAYRHPRRQRRAALLLLRPDRPVPGRPYRGRSLHRDAPGAPAPEREAMRPTRATIGRIIRVGQRSGALPPGTSAVGLAAYVRGYLRGMVLRRSAAPCQP